MVFRGKESSQSLCNALHDPIGKLLIIFFLSILCSIWSSREIKHIVSVVKNKLCFVSNHFYYIETIIIWDSLIASWNSFKLIESFLNSCFLSFFFHIFDVVILSLLGFLTLAFFSIKSTSGCSL
jgi:hypothetical protein